MSDQPQSLAELCSICYTEKPKYRCPRCKTQTCSLSCYKRHQQRASCNGQRDPAAYLKRSEWATPSGIDRDYNYLKSVERHVDRTGQDVRERGIASGPHVRGGDRGSASNKKVSKSWVPGSALQKYLSANDIMVEKAPIGMSRQKANLTRVTNKGNVMWTVEWMSKDGKKNVDDESSEGRQIKELWGEVIAKRLNVEKGKKRKRESEKQTATQDSQLQDTHDKEPQPPVLETTLDEQTGKGSGSTTDNGVDQQSEPPAVMEPANSQMHETSGHQEDTPGDSEEVSEVAPTPAPEHFYLLRPFTASKSTVLIPIDPTESLTEVLKSQTVLEFPTIYVMAEEPNLLPAGFQLVDQYEKLQKAEEAEVEGLVQRTNQSTGGALHAAGEAEKPLDANSILDMLKRDVGV